MAVLKITANIETGKPAECARFYAEVFDLKMVMDFGWICTLSADGRSAPVQLSTASEGGSDTPVPGLSIEVDDLAAVLARAKARGLSPEYGPTDEPWGVRRAYLRDPAGTLLNVLTHIRDDAAD